MQMGDRERRAERDALIRELRAERWSLRRIAAHPAVRLSAMGVSKVLAAPTFKSADDGPNELDELERWRLQYAAANAPGPDLCWPDDDDTGDYDAEVAAAEAQSRADSSPTL